MEKQEHHWIRISLRIVPRMALFIREFKQTRSERHVDDEHVCCCGAISSNSRPSQTSLTMVYFINPGYFYCETFIGDPVERTSIERDRCLRFDGTDKNSLSRSFFLADLEHSLPRIVIPVFFFPFCQLASALFFSLAIFFAPCCDGQLAQKEIRKRVNSIVAVVLISLLPFVDNTRIQ